MGKKQSIKLQAGRQRFEVKFLVDLGHPLTLVQGAPVLEGRTVEGDYVAVPANAEIKSLPLAFLPGDRVKSRTTGAEFEVVSGPHAQAIGDALLPAYLLQHEGAFSLIREELLEPDA